MAHHINPDTGNANVCSAKIKCPYKSVGDPHFDTKIEAEKHYEEKMKTPMSRGAELAIRRSNIQNEILSIFNNEKEEKKAELQNLIEIRNNIDKALQNLKEDEFHGKIFPSTHIDSYKIRDEDLAIFGDKTAYVGFDNELTHVSEEIREKLLKQFGEASHSWVSSLSNKEIQAVREFTGSSTSYKSYFDSEYTESFLSSLRKAPHFEKPVTLYSGLSDQMKEYFENAQIGGVVSLDRGISTTLNPGQINAFSYSKTGERYALVIESTKGAPLYYVSSNPHELETILPAGKFEIIEIEHDQSFAYTPENSGLSYGKVFKLKQLPEDI